MENWIEVKNETPIVGEYVLLLLEGETLLKGKLNYNGWAAFFADGEKKIGTREVTHWMYLPTLPGQEQKQRKQPLKLSREEIAAMAMQGFLASFAGHSTNPSINIIAVESVKYADALILELSKPQP